VKLAAATAASCRVKREKACTDRSSYDQTACGDQDFCADVVDWTAGTCSDVRREGPYGVGVRVVTMTKDSVTMPGNPRVLDTIVWYPTTSGAGPVDNFYRGVLDAPVDGSGGPYPILMFSHGSCGYAAQSTFLLPIIASRGFIVVAPPHPGNTIFDGASCGSGPSQLASFQERPADVKFALDSMLAENANPASDFFGLLDATRIGMSGHSFGGLTTYLVIGQDARYRAAVPMAPATFAGFSLGVPSLTVLGAIDSVVNNGTTRDAYAASTGPKYLAEIASTGHYAFSDLCPGGPNCVQPTTLTQDEAHAATLRWVVPFVQWKVGGDERFAAFFATPRPAGSTLEFVP
jgi:dienelactone hydrolase